MLRLKNFAAAKLTAALFLTLSLVMFLSASVKASESVNVYVDDNKLSQSGAMINGATMVPMRAIFEALGAEVKWEGSTRTITAKKDSTEIVLVIGKTEAFVNGTLKTLSAAPASVDGATMVPLRFIGEALGAEVKWEGATRTARVNSGANGVAIEDITITPNKPVKTGDTLTVTVKGEAGGKATFDVAGLRSGIPMHEDKNGVYTGTLTIMKDMEVSSGAVTCHIAKDGKTGTKKAAKKVEINSKNAKESNISDEDAAQYLVRLYPAPNAKVANANRVKATFVNKISAGSVRLFIDKKEVTTDTTVKDNVLTYKPEKVLAAGKHTAKLDGTDNEGIKISYTWKFTVSKNSSNTEPFITLTYPEDKSYVDSTVNLQGTTLPGCTVKFELVGNTSLFNLLSVKSKAVKAEVTADKDGKFSKQVSLSSSMPSGTVIEINAEVYEGDTVIATVSRTVTRK